MTGSNFLVLIQAIGQLATNAQYLEEEKNKKEKEKQNKTLNLNKIGF